MKTAGICVGASTVTVAEISLNHCDIEIIKTRSIPHGGNPRKILSQLFAGGFAQTPDRVVVTGRKLRHLVNATGIPEPEALEAAYSWWSRTTGKKAGTLISAGGETLMVYRLDNEGRIIEVRSGNKCASGTGEFFLQQIKRMDLSVEEAMNIADAENPYKVAGRCSVFCKSDCTHALNKGAPKSRVVSGLCKMMAGKITELLKGEEPGTVLLVGGSASNHIMVKFLEEEALHVVIPEHSRCFEALGAAIWALSHETNPRRRLIICLLKGSMFFPGTRPWGMPYPESGLWSPYGVMPGRATTVFWDLMWDQPPQRQYWYGAVIMPSWRVFILEPTAIRWARPGNAMQVLLLK